MVSSMSSTPSGLGQLRGGTSPVYDAHLPHTLPLTCREHRRRIRFMCLGGPRETHGGRAVASAQVADGPDAGANGVSPAKMRPLASVETRCVSGIVVASGPWRTQLVPAPPAFGAARFARHTPCRGTALLSPSERNSLVECGWLARRRDDPFLGRAAARVARRWHDASRRQRDPRSSGPHSPSGQVLGLPTPPQAW